jgi:hypothetical protein
MRKKPQRNCPGRVGVDVAAEFAGQVGGGGEHAAGDHVALEFGEPQLDLVEPRRVSRREVQAEVGMLVEERRHLLGLVGREVVEDDVNLLSGPAEGDDLAEKLDEVLAGVTRGGLAVDLTGLCV